LAYKGLLIVAAVIVFFAVIIGVWLAPRLDPSAA
jgi:hypothetical protein